MVVTRDWGKGTGKILFKTYKVLVIISARDPQYNIMLTVNNTVLYLEDLVMRINLVLSIQLKKRSKHPCSVPLLLISYL